MEKFILSVLAVFLMLPVQSSAQSDAVGSWETRSFRNHVDPGDPLLNGTYKSMVGIYQQCEAGNYSLGCRRDQSDSSFSQCLRNEKPLQGIGRVPLSEIKGGFKPDYPPRQIVCPPGSANCFSNSHPYKRHIASAQTSSGRTGVASIPKSCKPENAVPGCFGFGAKPVVRGGVMTNDHGLDGNLNSWAGIMGSPNEERCRAYDCAGFMGAVLYEGGMKMWKGGTEKRLAKDNAQYRTSTKQMELMFKGSYGADACMFPTRIGADGKIGSFIFGRGGDHSMVIHPKGDDPLGIRRALVSGNCNSIYAEHMDLEVVQSASLHDTIYSSIGPARMHWNAHTCGRQQWEVQGQDDTYYNYVQQGEGGARAIRQTEVDVKNCYQPRHRRTTHHLVYIRFRNAMENIARQACFDIQRTKQPVSMKSAMDNYMARQNNFWDRVSYWDQRNEKQYPGTLDNFKPDDKGDYFALSPNTSDDQCRLPDDGGKKKSLHRKGKGCAEECLARGAATRS